MDRDWVAAVERALTELLDKDVLGLRRRLDFEGRGRGVEQRQIGLGVGDGVGRDRGDDVVVADVRDHVERQGGTGLADVAGVIDLDRDELGVAVVQVERQLEAEIPRLVDRRLGDRGRVGLERIRVDESRQTGIAAGAEEGRLAEQGRFRRGADRDGAVDFGLTQAQGRRALGTVLIDGEGERTAKGDVVEYVSGLDGDGIRSIGERLGELEQVVSGRIGQHRDDDRLDRHALGVQEEEVRRSRSSRHGRRDGAEGCW